MTAFLTNAPARGLDFVAFSEFGHWLKDARKRRGLTLLALAEKGDTTHVSISRLESGERNPSRKMIEKIATALAPDGSSEEEIERIVADGLLAAGFLPSPGGLPEIERIPDEAILAQIEAYEGPNETLRGFKGFLKARAESREVPPPDDAGKL
jgi:transcriptional regulator with XRE-family HTH domain